MLSIALKNPKVKARLVGSDQTSCLVAKFENSQPPMLWQFDLERNHSFTLTVRETGDGAALGFLTPQGDFTAMATFVTREEAEEALGVVQKALMRQRRRSGFDWWRAFWVAVVVLATLFLFQPQRQFFNTLNMATAKRAAMLQSSATPPTVTAPAAAVNEPTPKATMRNGVPLPADDILKAPEE